MKNVISNVVGVGTPVAAFSPSDVAGLRLWLDANEAHLTKDGGDNVTQWNDRSGNGLNLTVPGGSNPPLWQDSQINGLPTITFDSGNSEALSRTLADFANSDSDGTAFAVIAAQGANSRIFTASDEATNVRFIVFEQMTFTGQKITISQRDSGAQDRVRGDTTISGSVQLIWESDSSNYHLRVDGVDQTESVEDGGDNGNWFADTPQTDNIVVGALTRTSTIYSDVEIAELLIYGPRLSTANRLLIETFLNDKYATF